MNSKHATSQGHMLDELIDDICDNIENGEEFDIEECIKQYPEYAEQIRKLYPTLLAINTLDQTTASNAGNVNAGLGETEELGDFKIVRQIGRGGMGVVYEAQQRSIARRVALKILPLASLVDPRALQRFKNEVTAIATLEHPNIVSVYAIGEERGIHYFAMQLIRGQSLAAVIKELRSRADQHTTLSGDMFGPLVTEMDQQFDVDPSKTDKEHDDGEELNETRA